MVYGPRVAPGVEGHGRAGLYARISGWSATAGCTDHQTASWPRRLSHAWRRPRRNSTRPLTNGLPERPASRTAGSSCGTRHGSRNLVYWGLAMERVVRARHLIPSLLVLGAVGGFWAGCTPAGQAGVGMNDVAAGETASPPPPAAAPPSASAPGGPASISGGDFTAEPAEGAERTEAAGSERLLHSVKEE